MKTFDFTESKTQCFIIWPMPKVLSQSVGYLSSLFLSRLLLLPFG